MLEYCLTDCDLGMPHKFGRVPKAPESIISAVASTNVSSGNVGCLSAGTVEG